MSDDPTLDKVMAFADQILKDEARHLERQKNEGSVWIEATCTCGVSESFGRYSQVECNGWQLNEGAIYCPLCASQSRLRLSIETHSMTREQAVETVIEYYQMVKRCNND